LKRRGKEGSKEGRIRGKEEERGRKARIER
jgi:hypothetical protein